jgi:hypothetical protein
MDQTLIIAVAFGTIAALVWILAMTTNPKAGILAIALMVFMSAIGVAFNWRGNIHGSWLLGLQVQRSYVFLALGVVLAGGMAMHLPTLRFNKLSGGALLLVLAGLYIGLMRMYHVDFIDGVQTMALAAIAIVALTVACAICINTQEDMYAPVRMVALGLGMFLICVVVQIGLDVSRIMNDSDRFIGVGSNPQIVATFLALSLVPVVWLLVNDRVNRYRPLWWTIGGAGAIALLATGSRTGLAMTFLGLGVVFVRRFGRLALAVPLAGFAVYVGFSAASAVGIELPLARFLSTENTRSAAWATLIQQFEASPLLGNGVEGAEKSENSYFYGAAAYGVGMLVLLIVFTVYSVWNVLRLYWRTRAYPSLHSVVDLIIAIHVMYFAGAFFEGYMISRVSAPLVIIVVAVSMASAILFQLSRQAEGELYFADAIERDDDDASPDDDPHGYDDAWDDIHDDAYAQAYQ